jgi:hypothetical protein
MRLAHKPKSSSKKTIIIAAIALLAIAAMVAFFVINSQRNSSVDSQGIQPVNTVDYESPTTEEQQTQEQKKQEIIEEQTKDGNPPPEETSDISVTITRADQYLPGQPLNVRTVITGATSGTCEITLTKAGQPTIQKTFDLVFEATSSMCKDADIAMAEFSEGGDWSLTVVAKSGGKQSAPATKQVTIAK